MKVLRLSRYLVAALALTGGVVAASLCAAAPAARPGYRASPVVQVDWQGPLSSPAPVSQSLRDVDSRQRSPLLLRPLRLRVPGSAAAPGNGSAAVASALAIAIGGDSCAVIRDGNNAGSSATSPVSRRGRTARSRRWCEKFALFKPGKIKVPSVRERWLRRGDARDGVVDKTHGSRSLSVQSSAISSHRRHSLWQLMPAHSASNLLAADAAEVCRNTLISASGAPEEISNS